ncbi:PilZ domain-containing protein [Magnetospirillum sp. SS-4]|uniref:PilZ domain-containing protein n=1 Tax=Magnetospirillum sp. SS-4 TaxID=2681465 RepID=UPI001382AC62|nr:PilZ domain-containing protein [Magnetospirillum sp. SS-4]CAA7621273.1 hypothetical protein MTBSS4_30216 [Magnetospirillum sp. SS-4]
MSFERTELRAYPRLSWAHPVLLEVSGIAQPAQVVDLSQGGCKLMPSDLIALIEVDIGPGSPLLVEIEGHRFEVVVRWATPNRTALGCAFEAPLSEADISALILRISDAANSRPARRPAPVPPVSMLVAS